MPVPDAEEVVGRDEDITWLDQCWNDGVRIATIVAMGGAGKSTLVHEWLERMDNAQWRGAERVYGWSFYRQGTGGGASSDEFFDDAFRWFGDPNPPTAAWEKGRRLAELVQKERTLLILDGIEPLQAKPNGADAAIQDTALKSLIRFLSSANAGLCLLTTRIHVADLKPKGPNVARTRELRRLSDEAGTALLHKRGAEGSKAELQAAVRDYDGHALALTLLGTYVREACDGQLSRRHGLPSFEGEPAQRMMALYEHWFAGKPELSILHLLGLFDRPAPSDEIEELRQDPPIVGLTEDIVRTRMWDAAWNTAVTRLRDVGLVAPKNTEGTLDVHPLVREYFGRRLQKERVEAFREGHRRLFEFLQKKAKPFPDTLVEMEPLYKAVVHGCLAGKHQEVLDEIWWQRIMRENEGFSSHKLGAFSNEVATLSAFFDSPWERVAPGLRGASQAFVLDEAGFSLRALGRFQEAEMLFRLSLEQRVAQENWEEAARATNKLSEVLQVRGALYEAVKVAQKSVELADYAKDAHLRASRRETLATAQHAMGLYQEAVALFEEAESMQQERQPEYPQLYSVGGFRYCELLLDQGRVGDVFTRAKQTLQWGTQANVDILSIALHHLSLGRAHLVGIESGMGGASNLNEATSHIKQAIDGLSSAGYREHQPRGLLARAELHTYTRAFADARADLDEAMDIATHCGFRLHECDAHLAYARLAIAEKNRTDAEAHLHRACQIIDDTGYHRRDRDVDEINKALAQFESSSSGEMNHG